MCTIRHLVLGTRLLRNATACTFSSRLQISTYVTSAFVNHSSVKQHNMTEDCSSNGLRAYKLLTWGHGSLGSLHTKYFTTKTGTPPGEEPEPPRLSITQRYKKMLKEYWYVLIPVHCVTSAIWLGSFYYAATCGLEIVPVLEYLGVSEEWIKPFRSSSLGYLAVATAFYKLASPARYTVTLGGTTLAIRVLSKRGLIKPMPSKEKMKEIVKQKRDDFVSRKTQQH